MASFSLLCLEFGFRLVLLHHCVCYDASLDLACCCLGHVVCEVYLFVIVSNMLDKQAGDEEME
jgi:hypothetical protein